MLPNNPSARIDELDSGSVFDKQWSEHGVCSDVLVLVQPNASRAFPYGKQPGHQGR